jgi:hypothetical protein
VMDSDGSMATQLGMDDSVIAFAGACQVTNAGYIASALAFLNGRWQDGVTYNYEITTAQFDEAMTHELGHFLGLDHSQINSNGSCTADSMAGRPLMYPVLFCSARIEAGIPRLAPDDIAWISYLYPSPLFAQQYGRISGYILFSDGTTQTQGANVTARLVDDPNTSADESARNAVSVVSGYLFTGNPGQDVTSTYLKCSPTSSCPNGYQGYNVGGSVLGSRDPLVIGYYSIPVPKGQYKVGVEGIEEGFTGGSSIGPLDPRFRLPGPPEFWNSTESAFDDINTSTPINVAPGQEIRDTNIILNGTPKRYDDLEDSGKLTLQYGGPEMGLDGERAA